MLLLLAPAKKRMRVKIKIRPRYLEQAEGRSQGGPLPTTIPLLDGSFWALVMMPPAEFAALGFADWSCGPGGGLSEFQILGRLFGSRTRLPFDYCPLGILGEVK